jgi:hypothetical protein
MDHYLNCFLFFLLTLFFGSACAPGSKPGVGEFENIRVCGAEEIDKDGRHFREENNGSVTFDNVDTRTGDVSFSGNYALELTPESPYGFTTELTAGTDNYIMVTAWRKGKDDKGVIVIDGGEGFYNAGKQVLKKNEDGWEKIFIEVFTPPHRIIQKIKIFVWNNSSDTVYFDDIQVIHRSNKKYPQYDRKDALYIYTEEEDLNYFNRKRIEAFRTGVLVNKDEDYAGAMIYGGNDFLNGSVRLKGDLTDHIQGDKWSFRIKLKKDFAWNNVRTFSVQSPITRNFLYEWLAHKIFIREDVLTTRYGFIPVYINNESKGIYAWEEHFEKHLVESNNRREGPIVRFDETLFWQRMIETRNTGREWDIDYFGGSVIRPFKENIVTSDSMMTMQAEEAHKLLLQYKELSMQVSDIFDIDQMARYYALIDITQAYHGFTWHNQRFYFNPVTCLLEPVAFDGYIEGGIYKRIDEPVISLLDPLKVPSLPGEELLLYQMFTDSLFNKKYLDYLMEYSDPGFIEDIITEYGSAADSLKDIIRQEFPYYSFDFDYIREQARYINGNLNKVKANIKKLGEAVGRIDRYQFKKVFTADVNRDLTPLLVHAYFDRKNRKIDMLNYHAGEIAIEGVMISDNLPHSFSPSLVLPAYDGINPGRAEAEVRGEPSGIIFSAGGNSFESNVNYWAYKDGMSSRQKLVSRIKNIDLPWKGDSIVFNGNYTYTEDVIIPPDTEVLLSPGTTIDLRKGAGFFSFSSLAAEGSPEDPVQIFSGDKASQGFHLIQVQKRSFLKNVHFYNLGSIHRGGWQTPSAVTFYEADVDMQHCVFESNIDCDDALNIVRSDFSVENCRFLDTFADSFDSDFCSGTITNCLFQNAGNDAIDFSGSKVIITGCRMEGVEDKAVSGGENSMLSVNDCIINKATIGVASKDLSHVAVKNSKVINAVYGLTAFIKKPEYGTSSIEADNTVFEKTMVLHMIEEGSLLTFNGRKIYGREKKLAIKLY